MKAPFLSELLGFINKFQDKKYKCSHDWGAFVLALASSSPVCAMIHPGNKLQPVLITIADGTTDLEISTLQFFTTELSCGIVAEGETPPKQLSPVLYELLKKANASPKSPHLKYLVFPLMMTIHISQLYQ